MQSRQKTVDAGSDDQYGWAKAHTGVRWGVCLTAADHGQDCPVEVAQRLQDRISTE